jgi:uncharacterized protein
MLSSHAKQLAEPSAPLAEAQPVAEPLAQPLGSAERPASVVARLLAPVHRARARATQLLAVLDLTPRAAGRTLIGFAIGLTGSLSFLWAGLPLPWFLGSLLMCIIASVLRVPFDKPKMLGVTTRAILGVTIGAAFTPELIGQFKGMLWSLGVLIPFMMLVMGAGMLFFERVAKFDRPTAFFCAVPGGLTDMVSMAADAGANTRTVTLVQATRIVLIIAILPFWLQWGGGKTISGMTPPGVHLSQFLLVDAIMLVALGWAGWKLAVQVGLAGAPLIGPMLLSGLAHALGWTAAKVPIEVLIFAQVTIGILLGAQFRGLTLNEFRTTMTWGAAFSVILIAVSVVFAKLVSKATGFDSTAVLLAYAPGGQTELNLIAYILKLDVAFTALHHLLRLGIVIFGAQLVFKLNKSWRGGEH